MVTVLDGIQRQAVAADGDPHGARMRDPRRRRPTGFAAAVDGGAPSRGRDRRRRRQVRAWSTAAPAASRSIVPIWAWPACSKQLVEAVVATGTPVVVVLINGRPLALPWIAAHVAGGARSLGAGRGGRHRGRRRLVRRLQPRRQAADLVAGHRRPGAGVLQPQALGRPLELERRLRRHQQPGRCSRSATGSSFTRFDYANLDDQSRSRRSAADTVRIARRRDQRRRRAAARRWCSSTSATWWRA